MREPQTKEYKHKQYLKHKDHIVEHSKEYYRKTRDRALACMKLYRSSHSSYFREYNKRYSRLHKKRLAKYNVVYRFDTQKRAAVFSSQKQEKVSVEKGILKRKSAMYKQQPRRI